MTLSANKDSRDPTYVEVRITYGPVMCTVVENKGHARSFHEQLGRLLDQIEEETK